MYEISDAMEQVDERTNELLELLENLIRCCTESPPPHNYTLDPEYCSGLSKRTGLHYLLIGN